MSLLAYFEDCNYFYKKNDDLIEVDCLAKVPQEVENYSRIMDSVAYFQQLGMFRCSPNKKGAGSLYQDYDLHLEVLTIGFNRYKQYFKVLYRGCREESRTCEEYKILYTSPSKEVAKFYGDTIREYRNVHALLTHGLGTSVVTGDYDHIDEEAIIVK